MSVKQGMAIGAIRESARELSRHAGDMDSLVTQATRSITTLQAAWQGDDFVSFKDSWDRTSKASLSSIADLLRSLSKDLTEEADAQQKTSDDYVGGTSTGSGDGTTGGGNPSSGGGDFGDDKKKDFEPPPIDGEHGKDAPANPYAPGTTRTTDPDGTERITDKHGNEWTVGPDGNPVQVAKDGKPLDPKDQVSNPNGYSHEEGKKGPGHYTENSRSWKDPLDWRSAGRGYTHESSTTPDNPYTRWKADPDSAWNDPRAEKVRDVNDRIGQHVDVSGKVGPLWDGSTGEKVDATAWEDRWGSEENYVEVKAGHAEASADAGYEIGPGGVSGTVGLGAGAYALSANGKFQTGSWGPASASGEGRVFVGGEARAEGTASIGPGGAKLGVGAEAFVGGKAEGEVTGKLGPAEATVGGEISYGVGAHFEADAEFSADKIGVKLDIGATLGIGGGLKVDFSVNPKDLLPDLPDLF
jgi:uncharacterized protein YukE